MTPADLRRCTRCSKIEKVAVVPQEMREVQRRGGTLSRWTPRSTFIFVAFLAQSRPTSRRQSSLRAPRAAKQVLEFLSASFSRLVFVLFQPDTSYDTARKVRNGRMDRRSSLVSFCADEKEVRTALCFSVHWLLSLGTCVRSAARSSAVQNLGPLSIKFRPLAAGCLLIIKS